MTFLVQKKSVLPPGFCKGEETLYIIWAQCIVAMAIINLINL